MNKQTNKLQAVLLLQDQEQQQQTINHHLSRAGLPVQISSAIRFCISIAVDCVVCSAVKQTDTDWHRLTDLNAVNTHTQ